MRIAVISDIHGNLAALEAVLEDMKQRDLEGAVHLGDFVGYGPRPNEVVEKIKEARIEGVVGNYDLAVCQDDPEEGLEKYLKKDISEVGRRTYEWTREKITGETKAFLLENPAKLYLSEGGLTFLFTHGSPEDPREYLSKETPEERLVELFEGTGCDVLVVGHTHLPSVREVGDKLLVNPGSVGRPKDGDPRAAYLILDTDNGFRAEHVRVTFNVESVADDCVSSGLPQEQAEGLLSGSSV